VVPEAAPDVEGERRACGAPRADRDGTG
jgi:hypothetical protein